MPWWAAAIGAAWWVNLLARWQAPGWWFARRQLDRCWQCGRRTARCPQHTYILAYPHGLHVVTLGGGRSFLAQLERLEPRPRPAPVYAEEHGPRSVYAWAAAEEDRRLSEGGYGV